MARLLRQYRDGGRARRIRRKLARVSDDAEATHVGVALGFAKALDDLDAKVESRGSQARLRAAAAALRTGDRVVYSRSARVTDPTDVDLSAAVERIEDPDTDLDEQVADTQKNSPEEHRSSPGYLKVDGEVFLKPVPRVGGSHRPVEFITQAFCEVVTSAAGQLVDAPVAPTRLAFHPGFGTSLVSPWLDGEFYPSDEDYADLANAADLPALAARDMVGSGTISRTR